MLPFDDPSIVINVRRVLDWGGSDDTVGGLRAGDVRLTSDIIITNHLRTTLREKETELLLYGASTAKVISARMR